MGREGPLGATNVRELESSGVSRRARQTVLDTNVMVLSDVITTLRVGDGCQ